MTVIGITGPTGAGKTTALGELARLGAVVIDCDALYHEILKSDIALQRELTDAFGDLSDGQGGLDRKKLGAVVFRAPAALSRLDGIVRPYILRGVQGEIDRARGAGRPAAVDGITIVETGIADLCDVTVAVLAPVEDRVRRICLREGIDESYARARVTAQKPDEFYRSRCDYVLYNDCETAEDFARQAEGLFSRLLAQTDN